MNWDELSTDEFPLSSAIKIDQPMIRHYAWASGDYNAIHQDEERAKAMGLPGVIAHGMLSLGLVTRSLEALATRLGASLASLETKFVGMTRVDDEISLSAKVINRGSDDLSLQVFAFRNGDRQALTCNATATLKRN